MSPAGRILLTVVLAFLAAIGGVFAGRALLPQPEAPGTALHQVLHHDLALDAAQQARLTGLEARFAVRHRALELEMRAANARLAEAIQTEHGYGPQVTAAIDRNHAAMGQLQKLTLAHIFAMRQLLRPDQTSRFDAAVVKALTRDDHG